MKPEKPNVKTSLVLTAGFQPIGFFNARSTIRNMMVGGVKGVCYDGNIYSWEDWVARTDFPEDQPCLRSARVSFPIPTIVVIPGFFGNFSKAAQKKYRRTSSLKQIYYLYDKTCQYCLKEIRFKDATKDHYVPKSIGGVNFDSNIVLSCKKCNNKKASKFPYFNADGEDVKPKVLSDVDFMLKADNIVVRDEWRKFLQY